MGSEILRSVHVVMMSALVHVVSYIELTKPVG